MALMLAVLGRLGLGVMLVMGVRLGGMFVIVLRAFRAVVVIGMRVVGNGCSTGRALRNPAGTTGSAGQGKHQGQDERNAV
jgi:hypothetical protein